MRIGALLMLAIVLLICLLQPAHASPELDKLKEAFPALPLANSTSQNRLVQDMHKDYSFWVRSLTDENLVSTTARLKEKALTDLARWQTITKGNSDTLAAHFNANFISRKIIPYITKLEALQPTDK